MLKFTCGHFDGLVQEICNSIANTLGLHLLCTNPSICNKTHYLQGKGGLWRNIGVLQDQSRKMYIECILFEYHFVNIFYSSSSELEESKHDLFIHHINHIKYKYIFNNILHEEGYKLPISAWYTGIILNAEIHLLTFVTRHITLGKRILMRKLMPAAASKQESIL